MDFNKGGGPVSTLLKARTSDSVYRDHTTAQTATSNASNSSPSFINNSFRQSSADSTLVVEDEFGSFASSSQPVRMEERPFESNWTSPTRRDGIPGEVESRGSTQDGLEIQSLLGVPASDSGTTHTTTTLTEEVSRDWEQELLENQRTKHDQDSFVPKDPSALLLPDSSAFARSQNQRLGHTSGDLSPVSSELLSSLSSLDLSSIEYLKTLLSLPPEEAIQRYLGSDDASYSDDVWGLPKEVKQVFVTANKGGEGQGENGRDKAVRRLGMLMKHLQLDTPSRQAVVPQIEHGKGKGKALEVESDLRIEHERVKLDAAELARAEWAKEWSEYPIAAGHVRSPPRSHFERSLPPVSHPLAPQEDFVARILPFPLPSSHDSRNNSAPVPNHSSSQAVFSVPSSLSSEAFVVHGYSNSSSDHATTYPQGVYHEVPRRDGAGQAPGRN